MSEVANLARSVSDKRWVFLLAILLTLLLLFLPRNEASEQESSTGIHRSDAKQQDLSSSFGDPGIHGQQWEVIFTPFPSDTTALALSDSFGELVINGSFETNDFTGWVHGGDLPQTITTTYSYDGNYSALLGMPTPAITQTQSSAWMSQTVTIPADMHAPTLSFSYRIFTNDMLGWSSFHVEIRDESGNIPLEKVLRDGFPDITQPPPGYDLDWRPCLYGLSAHKGETISLWFENKNEHDGAYGIWTYVDDVKIVNVIYLPVVLKNYTPTHTPTPTLTSTPTDTPITDTPILTLTPTHTLTPTLTPTPTPTPTGGLDKV